jgi:hypothetical protein
MPATDCPPSPTPAAHPPVTGPDGRPPPGWKWQIHFRRHRGEGWRVVVEATTAREAWDAMCDSRVSGEYRPVLVRCDLFDERLA